MMPERVYDIATLQRTFNLSFAQVYYRLMRLTPLFNRSGHTPQTKGRKLVLYPESMKLFRRLVELEGSGLSLKNAIHVLELETVQAERRGAEAVDEELPPQEVKLSEQLQSLSGELASLREEIRLLRRQHESLHRLLLQYLAPAAGQPVSESPAEAEQTPIVELSRGSNHPAKPPAT